MYSFNNIYIFTSLHILLLLSQKIKSWLLLSYKIRRYLQTSQNSFFLFFEAISTKAVSSAWLQEHQKHSIRCTQVLNTPFPPTQAHTNTCRAETGWDNKKKLCRDTYFKIEAAAQLHTDLRDSHLCCFLCRGQWNRCLVQPSRLIKPRRFLQGWKDSAPCSAQPASITAPCWHWQRCTGPSEGWRGRGDIMQPSSFHGDPHQRQCNRRPEGWTCPNTQWITFWSPWRSGAAPGKPRGGG